MRRKIVIRTFIFFMVLAPFAVAYIKWERPPQPEPEVVEAVLDKQMHARLVRQLEEPLAIDTPHGPEKERVLKLVYKHTIVNEASMYTPECDGGLWDRKTSSANFGSEYPKELKTLRHIIEGHVPIAAVPWHYRHLKEELVTLEDGTRIQAHRIRCPWVDHPGVYRIPLDRVNFRDRWGNPAKQRYRFDLFMLMPKKQAKKWGVPTVPIEVYKWEWVEE
jgi:hypothetical protein